MVKCGTTEYRMLHYWVEKNLGKPSKCEKCGTTKAKSFQWANKSKKYKKNLSDWERLCPTCHYRADFLKSFCSLGHKMTPINTYVTPNGHRRCVQCRRLHRKKYNDKIKLRRQTNERRRNF